MFAVGYDTHTKLGRCSECPRTFPEKNCTKQEEREEIEIEIEKRHVHTKRSKVTPKHFIVGCKHAKHCIISASASAASILNTSNLAKVRHDFE